MFKLELTDLINLENELTYQIDRLRDKIQRGSLIYKPVHYRKLVVQRRKIREQINRILDNMNKSA